MSNVVDAPARAAAINPVSSVCVSAPAGSGKTELLIQRYLGLLARVQRPEQVLAITFTRKAAAEMRERVMQALYNALEERPCDNAHQRVTRALAEEALVADQRGGWQLLQTVSRFNIRTIDGFCAGLTRQMPVLSQFGGQAMVQDDVSPLYVEAVRELYQLLDEDHPIATDLKALLLHFDNDWERLQTLLVTMLAQREQWRDYVGVHHAPQEAQDYLIATVETLVQSELEGLALLLAPYCHELLELLQFAARNLVEPIPNAYPRAASQYLPTWKKIRHLFLTANGNWRKKITKAEGFPADKGEPRLRKAQWHAVLDQVQQVDGLRERLAAVQILPAIEADSIAWQLVLHLSRLLPTLAAQLLLVFQKHGVVDHSQVAQSALFALGDDDSPTELALRLDYQIEHILVDEFQDTAITQFELLHKLTRGWGEYNAQHAEAPRTLMLVGDGMQSIYGFRGANVGLFLKARREGFNGVMLRHLELRCNFRSDRGVVDWVNETFSQAFPASDDAYRSQVSYSPATAVRETGTEPAVELHAFSGSNAQAQEVAFICSQIATCIETSSDSIAVLGRSRSHLQTVIQQLKQLNICYNAPQLDSLSQSTVVADLLTLCRVLANDADRLAWMALLRAPWCGLTLDDLLRVARFGDAGKYTPVWSSLQDPRLLHSLSADGRQRLLHILPALRQARDKRDRLSLRAWVEQLWFGLGGPQCAPEAGNLQDAETFLQLLEQAEAEGAGFDLNWLSLRLQKCFMSAGDPDSKVHLLTLHKAKGLEFDRVIIPQLDRQPRSDGRDLLLWDEHSNPRGERSFLLAADDHSGADAPTLYNYLKSQRRQKSLLENTRLLYVGATRAARRLLLTAAVKFDAKTGLPGKPPEHSLLSPIWQIFQRQMTVHAPLPVHDHTRPTRAARPLTRLVRPAPPSSAGDVTATKPPAPTIPTAPESPGCMERCVGRVVHLALEELSRHPRLPAACSARDQQRWRMALQREGLWGKALDDGLAVVLHSVAQVLRAGSTGRWVLADEHADARSEWTLTTVDAKGLIHDIVIDRCFIDSSTGERWVIDYKTSSPARGESMDAFTTRESAAYREQLRRYRDAVRELGNEPVRCALFFTALGLLHVLTELDLPESET